MCLCVNWFALVIVSVNAFRLGYISISHLDSWLRLATFATRWLELELALEFEFVNYVTDSHAQLSQHVK